MSSHEYSSYSFRRSPSSRALHAFLVLGLFAALAGDVYQFRKMERMEQEAARTHRSLQNQVTRLSDATSGGFDVALHRFEKLELLQQSTSNALSDARSVLQQNNVAAGLQEVNALHQKQPVPL